MYSIEYMGKKIEYDIVKSKRKTVSIRVNLQGVTVRAPLTMSIWKIQELVSTKAKWIVNQYEKMHQGDPIETFHTYQTGDMFLYRGIPTKLIVIESEKKHKKVELRDGEIIIRSNDVTPDCILNCLKNWYRKQARERLIDRVDDFCSIYDFGKPVNNISIKDQKSRWGSCSSKSNLNFNYRLILAPDEILDYVVVHELCHLLFMNHSKDFWRAVETILPDYKKSREWLKNSSRALTID